MKIAIDARMYGLEHAGIGRYIINLIDQIDKLDRQNDYFILLRKKYCQQINFSNPRFKKILADYPHYSLKEQLLLPLQLIKLHPDLVHFPHFNVPILWFGKYVVTIHDLIKHESRGPETTTRWQLLYWFKYLAYRLLIWLAIKRAAKIITPSRWWKTELIKRYQLAAKKIAVTYEGANEFLKEPPAETRSQKLLERLKIKRPFILYVGNLYPHKNIERLVEAVKILNEKTNLKLVIVCPRNVFFERFIKRVKERGWGKFTNLVGFLETKELNLLYHQAEVFAFPSLMEGFGLPGLEAMAAGLPVVASNSSCLPEIYDEAALYFDPYDVNDMADKIGSVIRNPKIRNALVEKGFTQVAKYSWQKMARQTLNIYHSVLES